MRRDPNRSNRKSAMTHRVPPMITPPANHIHHETIMPSMATVPTGTAGSMQPGCHSAKFTPLLPS
jgi:hypothetical protein